MLENDISKYKVEHQEIGMTILKTSSYTFVGDPIS